MSNTNGKSFTPNKGTLVTLVLAAMLSIMGGAAVAPALPAISEAFPESPETVVSLVITLPSLAIAVSGFFVGALADRFGKARTLIISLAVFTISGLSGLVAPNLEILLVGRFIMGVAIAGISTTTAALAAEYYDADTRAKVYGLQSAATGASVLLLETTGGFLALINWRVPFLVYTVGFVFLILAALFIREATHEPAGIDTGVDGASGEGAAGELGPADTPLVGDEVRLTELDVETGLERAKTDRFVLVATLLGGFLALTIGFLIPSKMPYLIASFGKSTAVAGLILAVFGTMNIVGALVSAPLAQRFRRSSIIVTCFVIVACGCTIAAFSDGVLLAAVGTFFIGGAVGCVVPLLTNWLASQSTHENSGKHMGAFTTATSLGQFASSLHSGLILSIFGTHQAIFAFGAVLGLVIAFVAFCLRKRIDR